MKKLNFFIDSILYSYAQIFFSNRKWFGVVALISSFASPAVGLSALVGGCLSNIIAIILKYDKEKIKSGFYGFNGLLFAGASAFFFDFNPTIILLTFVFILFAFFISTSMEHLLANVLNLPGLSLPFILTLYIFFIFITNYNSAPYRHLISSLNFKDEFLFVFITGYFKSLGLILLQSKAAAGIFLAGAILIFSRVMFINSIFAYSVNYLLLKILYPQFDSDFFILTSFNSILISFALGGSLVLVSKKSFLLIAAASIFTILLSGFFAKLLQTFFLPVLVLPFNFITLAAIYSLKFRAEQSDFVLLYFKPGSPEENYYYHQNRKSRFERFKLLFAELPFWGEWKISQGINGGITHKDEWRYAWDFVIEENGREFKGEGSAEDDYFCFGAPVVAPLDGEVVKVVDSITDNKIGEFNLDANWGNSIVINHGEGLFSKLSHLRKKSIKFKEGDKVKKGTVIAQCGNSGRSPTPHLHFQFQLTDRIGDKTYKFPFSHYITEDADKQYLKSFDYPGEKEIIKNIEVHKTLKNAFNFQFGDEFEFECSLNGEEFKEKWRIEVDILNHTYIASDRNAKAYFFKKEKIFLMSDFIGEKKSALHYFYLMALRVPLGYYENLEWEDELPVSLTMNNAVRFLSEFLLMFDQQLHSSIKTYFLPRENSQDDFVLGSDLRNKGKRFFKFADERGGGKLYIDPDGYIKSYKFTIGKNKFSAELKRKE